MDSPQIDNVDIGTIMRCLSEEQYVADDGLAAAVVLSLRLEKPLLLEGEPGVGKTELAVSLARCLHRSLIRLQCYEGIDSATSLYEWNYPRQMLEIRIQEARGLKKSSIASDIYGDEFLLKRPLLQAIDGNHDHPPVLLIDEVDRADEEFEAYLLELLSEFQITIPEIGTIRAKHIPVVILTSNRTRDVHAALRRRCLYHWIDFPTLERQLEILRMRVPGLDELLAAEIAVFVHDIGQFDLFKRPSIAESVTWAEALVDLGIGELGEEALDRSISSILKYKEDIQVVMRHDVSKTLHGVRKKAERLRTHQTEAII